MIDILHTDGCGELALRTRGQPVGRDFEPADALSVVKDAEGNEIGLGIGESMRCSSCGELVSLEDARAQVGRGDPEPTVTELVYQPPSDTA